MSRKKGLSISSLRRQVSETKYTMFKNGMFDPDCPNGYNFLLGSVAHRSGDTRLNKNPITEQLHIKTLPTADIY